eukprot:350255-Chlamydomonas_euryale.AAC.16
MAFGASGGLDGGAAAGEAAGLLASDAGVGGPRGSLNGSAAASTSDGSEHAALALWRQWAEEALGPMSAEPTAEQLGARTKRTKALERKCAELAAAAQRRLTASATLHDGGSLVAGAGMESGMHRGMRGSSRPASARLLAQQAGWAAREARKARTYDVVRLIGCAEREGGGARATAAVSGTATDVPFGSRSHAMLEAVLQGGAPAASPATSVHHAPGPPALQRQPTRYSSNVGRAPSMRPRSARSSGASQNGDTQRPHSARAPSSCATPATGAHDAGGPAAAAGAMPGMHAAALQAEAEALRQQLDAAHASVVSQSEVEAQLRDTIDLLRARLHGQSQRELENQRRLQQHSQLEPLFDRLAEQFSFSTPEQVLDRLELLEDDRLGTFDQLLQTQDEVTALQSSLNEANKRVELVRTQLTTERLHSSARLQQQNEELRLELESMEALNQRLEARQHQLVCMQSAVADLWGRCQDDPRFVAANQDDPDAAAASIDNPLNVLSACKEYVIAKSGPMANRHYLESQRIANRVWARHFVHKKDMRGKVLETFEQLSTLADLMAAKIRAADDQLKRCVADGRSRKADGSRMQRERGLRNMDGTLVGA